MNIMNQINQINHMNHIITGILFVLYLFLGRKVFYTAFCNIKKGEVFDENFLMAIASLGAFLIGEAPEGLGLMIFYRIGEHFQDRAVERSEDSIRKMMDIRPDFARIETEEGGLSECSPETVAVGGIIVVKPGEKIPMDGVILEGESALDTKALTGEALPRTVRVGDEILSGCVNGSGLLRIRVTKIFAESTASKILDLVKDAAENKAPAEKFITSFAKVYTPVVVFAAVLLAVLPPLIFGGMWSEWIRRALIFLVVSCPCALVISVPLSFFSGIGAASRNGILIKGGNYLEALSKVNCVVFDKTGTLTKGVFEVEKILPANGFSKETLLSLGGLAESFSNHPIAVSIQKAYQNMLDESPVNDKSQLSKQEEVAGVGVYVRVNDKSQLSDYEEISGQGVRLLVNGKRVVAGNGILMNAEGIAFTETGEVGTKVYLAREGVFAGTIVIADEIKADAKAAVAGLKALGIQKTVLLTGDHDQAGKWLSNEVGLDEYYAELLPGDKLEKLEQLERENANTGSGKNKLAFVGDGINDAPALARADIGIAMGGIGQDAAIEAADVVLMTDEPSKLLEAIALARYTKRIVWQNIVFAIAVKVLILVLGTLGLTNMWVAIFADVGVALLAVGNALRVGRPAESNLAKSSVIEDPA
ncbi:hypothetical protein FACS1894111_01920 [Clostridia bacterium]|nr:hypothetical protein FACS1894111_01920 [Clostridia bacterium]